MRRIGDAAERQGKGASLRAYLATIVQANAFAAREVVSMGFLHPVLEEALRENGYIAKWDAETRAEERFNIAQNMIGLGLPFETIVSATKLAPEKVRELYAPVGGTT